MGRAPALAATLALSGCAQLFGIADTSGPPDAASPTVSLSFDRLSIGSTVVRTPQALDAPLYANFLVPDANDPSVLDNVAASLSAPNTWSAAIPTGSPAVDFTLPDYPSALERQWAFGRTMYGLFGQMEHANKQPAPANATLHATIALPSAYAAGEAFQVYIVGTWAVHGLSAAELPAANTGATQIDAVLAYDTAANHFAAITGRPLDAITSDDVVLVLRYVGNSLTGTYATSFDETGSDVVAGAMTAVAQSDALDITIQPAMPANRFATVRPAVMGIAMGWDLHAAPGYLYVNNNGPVLGGAGLSPTSAAHITQTFANPFTARGWNSIFNWNNYETRTIMVTGPNLQATLYAGLQQLAEPSPGLQLDIPAGLPLLVSLNQVPLATDNMTMTLDPTKPVEVSFVADQPNNTYYAAQVYELVPNAPTGATALQYEFRYGASALVPKFQLPPGVLQPGHYYTLRALCISGGYPAIASGDLTQRSLPFAQGYLDSGVFTVQ